MVRHLERRREPVETIFFGVARKRCPYERDARQRAAATRLAAQELDCRECDRTARAMPDQNEWEWSCRRR